MSACRLFAVPRNPRSAGNAGCLGDMSRLSRPELGHTSHSLRELHVTADLFRPVRNGGPDLLDQAAERCGDGLVTVPGRVLIKAAPPRGAASGAPRAGLCLGRPVRRTRAVLSLSVPPIFYACSSWHAVQQRPVLLAFDCPAPGRGSRLRGGRDGAVKRDFPDLAIHDRPGQRLSAQSRAGPLV